MKTFAKVGCIASMMFCLNPLIALASPPVITSIQRVEGCTTLTWTSVLGEFYTVYWTDTLGPNAWWRVAAMHVPAEGGGVPVRPGLNVVVDRH